MFISMGYNFNQVEAIDNIVLDRLKNGGDVEKPYTPLSVPDNMSAILHSIMEKINQTNPSCTSYGFESVAGDYLAHKYHSYLQGYPVLVQPQCLTMVYFGNLLGALLDQMACAADAGAHFIAVRHATQALHQHAHHDDEKKKLHHARQEGAAAYAFYSQSLSHNPEMLLAAYGAAEILMVSREFGEALSLFEKVLKLKPADKDTLAYVLLLRGVVRGEVAPLGAVREEVLALRAGKGMVLDATD
ncbi:hypothetical protein EON63_20300, partial [archaeon]